MTSRSRHRQRYRKRQTNLKRTDVARARTSKKESKKSNHPKLSSASTHPQTKTDLRRGRRFARCRVVVGERRPQGARLQATASKSAEARWCPSSAREDDARRFQGRFDMRHRPGRIKDSEGMADTLALFRKVESGPQAVAPPKA